MSNEVANPMTASVAQNEKLEKFTRILEAFRDAHPETEVDIATEHHLHAGVYSRTIFVPKGTVVAGVQIQVATQLVFCGKGQFTDGKTVRDIDGYVVMDGSPKRRAAFLSKGDTWMTMFFATNAKTVKEAEEEFCSEPERLGTRRKEKLLCQDG